MRGRRGEKGKRRAALPAFPRVPPPRGFSRLPLYLRARSGSSPGPAGWDGGGGKMEDRQRTRRPPDARRCGAEGGIPAVPFPVRGAQRGGGRAAGPGAASRERCGGAGGPGALRAVPALGFRERLRSGSAVSRRPTFISFEKSKEMKEKKKNPEFFIFFTSSFSFGQAAFFLLLLFLFWNPQPQLPLSPSSAPRGGSPGSVPPRRSLRARSFPPCREPGGGGGAGSAGTAPRPEASGGNRTTADRCPATREVRSPAPAGTLLCPALCALRSALCARGPSWGTAAAGESPRRGWDVMR